MLYCAHKNIRAWAAILFNANRSNGVQQVNKIKPQGGAKSRPKPEYDALPLVYSCSGCSSAAQLANSLAVRLDRERLAEMSCIAGVGGNVQPLVRTAQSGRKVVVLDGCALHCAKRCLEQHGISASAHIDLSEAGVRKRFHKDATPEEDRRVWESVVLPEVARLNPLENAAPETAQETHRSGG
ncbi:MAG: zinc-binding protein [Gallionella sp.]|nr:MAG: zinc-binding protein [Gallionella sp.]